MTIQGWKPPALTTALRAALLTALSLLLLLRREGFLGGGATASSPGPSLAGFSSGFCSRSSSAGFSCASLSAAWEGASAGASGAWPSDFSAFSAMIGATSMTSLQPGHFAFLAVSETRIAFPHSGHSSRTLPIRSSPRTSVRFRRRRPSGRAVAGKISPN